jgi:hypothetical protein
VHPADQRVHLKRYIQPRHPDDLDDIEILEQEVAAAGSHNVAPFAIAWTKDVVFAKDGYHALELVIHQIMEDFPILLNKEGYVVPDDPRFGAIALDEW